MAKYRLFVGRNNKYYFHLENDDNEMLLCSQGHNTKSSCLNAIASARLNSGHDVRYEMKNTNPQELYFIMSALNGYTIATSKMFATTIERNKTIEWVKTYAPFAALHDETK